MNKVIRSFLSPGNTFGIIALIIAITGSAYAATLARNSVGSAQIRNGTVKNVDLAGNSVTSAKIFADAITGGDVNELTLGKVPLATSADTATTADSATTAGSATTASTADVANSVADGAITRDKLPTAIAARAVVVTALPVPDATAYYPAFDYTDFDSGDLWSIADPARLTAPISGVYQISATTGWAANVTGSRTMRVLHNHAGRVGSVKNPGSSDTIFQSLSTIHYLDAGDYIEIQLLQDSGGALDTMARFDSDGTTLAMHWVGTTGT